MPADGRAPGLLPGTLDLLILKTLSRGPDHGYGIARRIRQVSEKVLEVEEGSLYPALHRLEKRGLLVSRWCRSESNRRAKLYRLTRRGRAQLAREEASWCTVAEAVGRVLSAPRARAAGGAT